jgi:hypothetical protein
MASDVWVACYGPTCVSSGNCDGSFAKPYPSLQVALNALGSGGGKITVLPGSYCLGNDNSNLQISNKNIEIVGQIPHTSYIWCQNSGRRAFLVSNAGFTLNGLDIYSCGDYSADGGAMLLSQANVVLKNIWLYYNLADKGGAIYATQGSLNIEDSYIEYNYVDHVNGGGGIYHQQTNINFKNTFVQNNYNIIDWYTTDVNCVQGSASNVNSYLDKVTCSSCFIPRADGQQDCT